MPTALPPQTGTCADVVGFRAAVRKSATVAVRLADCGRRESRLVLRTGLCQGDVDRRRDRFQKTFGINLCEVEPFAIAEEVEALTSRQHDRADDDDGLGFG